MHMRIMKLLHDQIGKLRQPWSDIKDNVQWRKKIMKRPNFGLPSLNGTNGPQNVCIFLSHIHLRLLKQQIENRKIKD